jgi:hypothetical protein
MPFRRSRLAGVRMVTVGMPMIMLMGMIIMAVIVLMVRVVVFMRV